VPATDGSRTDSAELVGHYSGNDLCGSADVKTIAKIIAIILLVGTSTAILVWCAS
jgi:hypothetical protein